MTSVILLITNEHDITTDFIVKRLKERDVKFYRLNTNRIGSQHLLSFDVNSGNNVIVDKNTGETIFLSDVSAVYFRRPEIPPSSDTLSQAEKQFVRNELHYVLEGLYQTLSHAFWISNVYAIREAENKIYQLSLAKKIGFLIPNTIITNNQTDAIKFFNAQPECIIKPIKSGLISFENTEEGVIFTSKPNTVIENSSRIESCPILLQNHIEKQGDLRVTVIGKKVYSAFIHSQDLEYSKTDWRMAPHPLKHSAFELPSNIAARCVQLTEELNLTYGAIDLILDKDKNYIFLEINPNGQWAWIEKQLNYPLSDEICKLLIRNI